MEDTKFEVDDRKPSYEKCVSKEGKTENTGQIRVPYISSLLYDYRSIASCVNRVEEYKCRD